MDKQYLHEKLAGLRNKYVESANEETNASFLDEAKMNKKMLRIKKKIGKSRDGALPKDD